MFDDFTSGGEEPEAPAVVLRVAALVGARPSAGVRMGTRKLSGHGGPRGRRLHMDLARFRELAHASSYPIEDHEDVLRVQRAVQWAEATIATRLALLAALGVVPPANRVGELGIGRVEEEAHRFLLAHPDVPPVPRPRLGYSPG